MELFNRFIELFKFIDCDIIDNRSDLRIESKINESIIEFLSYDSVSTIKGYFGNCIKIYTKRAFDELNLIEYLDNEFEFNEIVSKITENHSIKVILDKEKYITSLFGKDYKITLLIFNSSFEEIFSNYRRLEENIETGTKNVFILLNKDYYFHNDFYLVTNINREDYELEIKNYVKGITCPNTKNIIDKRNELCNWVGGTLELTPNHIYIDFDQADFITDSNIKMQIFKNTIDLIFPFLSNYTVKGDNAYLCTINGNKRIEIVIASEINSYSLDAYVNLFRMYEWIYENYSFDKINIFRNVISILISAKRGEECPNDIYKIILSNADWLKNSVEDNFQKLLSGNVNDYFKEKNNIMQSIKQNITNTNNQVTELTKVLNTNLLSLIGIIIAGVVGYLAKGEVRLVKILGLLYIFQLDISALFQLPLAGIRVNQLNKDFNNSKNQYIKSYTLDKDIQTASSSHDTNSIIFIIYMVLISLVIIGINIGVILLINDYIQISI